MTVLIYYKFAEYSNFMEIAIIKSLQLYLFSNNNNNNKQQINFINNYQLKEEHAQLAYSIS